MIQPALSFDRSIGDKGISVGVDYQRLTVAFEDAGLSDAAISETSVHFFNAKMYEDVVGAATFPGWSSRNLGQLGTYIRNGWARGYGFQDHQFKFRYAVLVGIHEPEYVRRSIDQVLKEWIPRKSYKKELRKLEAGDFLGSVLAHEVRHLSQREKSRASKLKVAGSMGIIASSFLLGQRPRLANRYWRDGEDDANSYLASCIDRGEENPWLGAIAIE